MPVNGAPPAGVPADELVLLLASREPPSEVIEFPSSNSEAAMGKPVQQIRLVMLKAAQKSQARQKAAAWAREQFKVQWKREPTADDMAAVDVEEARSDRFICEVLVMACRSVNKVGNTYLALFHSAQWLQDNLDSTELGVLFQHYIQFEQTKGAIEHVLDDDPLTLRMWVSRLKSGMWALGPLARLASLDLAELVLSWAKLTDKLESLGFDILDPQFLSSLSSLELSQESSQQGIGSSGEQPASSIPTTISAEQARDLARELRGRRQ